MRRLVISLVSCALVLALAAPAAAATRTDTVYLAMGDSLAWGDGASVPAHTSYVPRLAGYFQGAAHAGADELVNVGVRGETTASFISAGQLTEALAVINDPETDVRVLTLSIGGNDMQDLLKGPPCLPDPTTPECQALVANTMVTAGTNLGYILTQLHTALAAEDQASEPVFVLTLFNPLGGSGLPLEPVFDGALLGSDLALDCANLPGYGFDDVIGCTAAAFHDPVVDGYDLFGDNGFWLTHASEGTFNFHPTDDGYALIAWGHRQVERGL